MTKENKKVELKEGDLTKVAGGIPHNEYTETSDFAGNCGYFPQINLDGQCKSGIRDVYLYEADSPC